MARVKHNSTISDFMSQYFLLNYYPWKLKLLNWKLKAPEYLFKINIKIMIFVSHLIFSITIQSIYIYTCDHTNRLVIDNTIRGKYEKHKIKLNMKKYWLLGNTCVNDGNTNHMPKPSYV